MYSYIKGTIQEVYEDLIVVENNGIGYNIHIPMRILDELPGRDGQVKIYTYLHVREEAFRCSDSCPEMNLICLSYC